MGLGPVGKVLRRAEAHPRATGKLTSFARGAGLPGGSGLSSPSLTANTPESVPSAEAQRRVAAVGLPGGATGPGGGVPMTPVTPEAQRAGLPLGADGRARPDPGACSEIPPATLPAALPAVTEGRRAPQLLPRPGHLPELRPLPEPSGARRVARAARGSSRPAGPAQQEPWPWHGPPAPLNAGIASRRRPLPAVPTAPLPRGCPRAPESLSPALKPLPAIQPHCLTVPSPPSRRWRSGSVPGPWRQASLCHVLTGPKEGEGPPASSHLRGPH